MLEGLEPQLKQIARQVVVKHGNWRVEYEDMLQEARIGAWRGLDYAVRKELAPDKARSYALVAARRECERCVRGMKRDALWDAETGWNIDGGIGETMETA